MGYRNKLKWGKKKDITDVTEVKKKKDNLKGNDFHVIL